MRISVVIPNYNGKHYIKKCLDSLYNQTHKNFEIIVVDNNSHDQSDIFIESQYSNIKLIKNSENYGFSYAVNQGIKVAKGEYVVLLNNDTIAQINWLEALIACFESDEKIFSVCSKMIRFNEPEKIDDAGDLYTIFGWALKRGDGDSIKRFAENNSVFVSCAGAAIYRKSILDEIGYFDENFFAYMEDVDISYRAKIHGYRNMYCADAKILHIGSATSGSRYNAFKVKLAARNNVYVAYKNMPLFQLLINLPFLCLGFGVKYLFFSKKGFRKEYSDGFKEGIRNLKKIQKVTFRWRNTVNYLKIQLELICNVFKYAWYKIK